MMTRPVVAWPVRTAWWLSPVAAHSSRIPGDQEHLVVHRQAEQDREHQHGQERFDRAGLAEVEQPQSELGFVFGQLLQAAARMTAARQAGVEKAAALVTTVFLHGTQSRQGQV